MNVLYTDPLNQSYFPLVSPNRSLFSRFGMDPICVSTHETTHFSMSSRKLLTSLSLESGETRSRAASWQSIAHLVIRCCKTVQNCNIKYNFLKCENKSTASEHHTLLYRSDSFQKKIHSCSNMVLSVVH